jgi:hypothetical protein
MLHAERRRRRAWPAPLALAVLGFSAAAGAQAPPPAVWSGNNAGSAREFSLAIDAGRVFLSEAGAITVVDRSTHAAAVVRFDLGGYLPVASTVPADGLLWLGLGSDARASRPRLATFDPASGQTHERVRTDDVPCSLVDSSGELFWVDRGGRHVHRLAAGPAGARPTVVATAPGRRHFMTDCRLPLAVDATHVYLALAGAVPTAPTPLVRIPRHGGPREVLAPDVAGRAVLMGSGALVLTYVVGTRASIERFELATRARTTLVATATVVAIAVHGARVMYLDGNSFSGDAYAVRRVGLGGGPPETLVQGDQRLGTAIAFDAAGATVLVQGHPPSECTTHHALEPGDRAFTRCAAPDHQLLALPP